MKLFKEPDHRDTAARYVWDSAGRDFWRKKNLFGKLICLPILALLCALSGLMMLTDKPGRES